MKEAKRERESGKWAEEKEKRGEKGEEVEKEMERSLGEKRERRVVSTSECSSVSIYPEMREVRARSLLLNH